MNQQKIGKFIAACRKEKHLTQAVLAEQLGITDRAVSKWETGKCMPDISLIPELCEVLEININELLSGERLTMTNYQKMAEENLMQLKKQEELNNKKLLQMEVIIGTVSTAFYLIILFALIADLSAQGKNSVSLEELDGFKLTTLIISIILWLGSIYYCVKLEHDVGYYECPNCGEAYIPTMKAVFFAPHIGRSRKMLCPHCHQKGYHKKVLYKENKDETTSL